MSVQIIRFQVSDEGVAEVVAAVEQTFAAVRARRPEGVRYTYYRQAGSNEFVALLELDEGVENPLFGIPEAQRLRSTVADWATGDAPAPTPLEVLGAYQASR